jgi:gas vesicle protein
MARTKFGAAVKWGVIGAAATYLFDPERGADRRRQLQDKVRGAARERKDELAGRFSGATPATSRNGTSDAGAVEPLPDRIAEEIQTEPGAPGGPSVAPPTS